jgi:glycine/D-amino acid oxidase-like deaminating enzyme
MHRKREEIAIIGAGLGGCLTALMLAKNPRYHVTLIEAQDTILNGASLIASRLHLGGEYPLHLDAKDHKPITGYDCLHSAVIWKLLMPENIYTPTPPMKFLVANATEQEARSGKVAEEKTLTVDKYLHYYEQIRVRYQELFKQVRDAFRWRQDRIAQKLFGLPDRGIFFHKLQPKEYNNYKDIAGGFESQELGLNVPKYLTMIQGEIKRQEKKGNITLLTGHRVSAQGIGGEYGDFRIHCENGKAIEAHQIIQAAWQGGPAITKLPPGKVMKVYKRAMLLVDLPEGQQPPPAFVMLGEHGGMLASYNNKVAICYLPRPKAAYRNRSTLDRETSNLPENWDTFSTLEKKMWKDEYFILLKERFPVLKKATKARLVIRDTISFEDDLAHRSHHKAGAAVSTSFTLSRKLKMEPVQVQIQAYEYPVLSEEYKEGLFVLYPTKATYCPLAAVQATYMVEERSRDPKTSIIDPPADPLQIVLGRGGRERYSLSHMAEPTPVMREEFFRHHLELDRKIWPEAQLERSWTSRSCLSPEWGIS